MDFCRLFLSYAFNPALLDYLFLALHNTMCLLLLGYYSNL